ncbi:AAA family ATPase [Candidatus Kaiserbacteria bacterium]|nr:AAA family ATPase [Candidatus Kaiserbacteria bacterium]
MYLQSLEVSGFKSFAKKAELEFSTPITGIVGPNGSGKSNVVEAFRFVLGEQSIKSMRGKKGEDLIWGGGTSLARANRASVKIVLNNESRLFPIDFDTVTVERVVNRDGENEYSINGSRTRLRDVQELLSAANIGSTGHHIISQGEADRILSANPKERREMIEDALGLKLYQYKKAESEKKLEKTKENIAQVTSLRKEIQPHLHFLERQVKKLEKSTELRDRLTAFYKAYLLREELYLEHHTKRLREEERAPEAELAVLKHELAKAKQTLAEAEKDEKRDALVRLEAQLSVLRHKRQEVLRESGRVEGQLGYLERQAADHARKKERETHPPVPFAEVTRVVDQVEQVAQSAHGEEDTAGLRRVIESMVRTLRSFLNETARIHTDTPEETRLERELGKLREEKEHNERTLAAIDGEEQSLSREYETLKRSIEAEASESRAAEREVFRIMGRERELIEIKNRVTRETQMLERDREEFTRELKEGAILVGFEITRYREHTVDPDGMSLTAVVVVDEDRSVQLGRRRELEKMKIRLEELGASGGGEVMKEYEEVKGREAFLSREIADLEQSIEKLAELIVDLTEKLNEEFVGGIEKINTEFNRFFMLMFGGGSANLLRIKPKVRRKKSDLEGLLAGDGEGGDLPDDGGEDEDSSVDGEEGVDIDVKLPNKRVRGLEMLSGGERALTSIALIFAMSQVNPPLFVILDETDAALDEANSRRYGDMIESLAKKSQLILITHNRETMSRAGVLYGVTMGGDGISKLLSVKLEEAVAVAK